MVDLTDADFRRAKRRGRSFSKAGPSAKAVILDRDKRELVLHLANGCTLRVPAGLIEGLAGVEDDIIADCTLLGAGSGLHWETLDLDLSVADLLNGLFGTQRWMAGLGGRSTSPAKTAAARENGAKGGRPRTKPSKPD